jgi:hypothetical protein
VQTFERILLLSQFWGFIFGANDWGFFRNNIPVLRFNLFLFKEKRKRIFTATGAKFGKIGVFLYAD